MSEPKQVIVIRKDLKMRRGKEIAQGAHASMMWLRSWHLRRRLGVVGPMSVAQETWLFGEGFKKVVCQVDSEVELNLLGIACTEAGVEFFRVVDQGRTEFDGVPTVTALAIGPDYPEKIDPITKHMKLY